MFSNPTHYQCVGPSIKLVSMQLLWFIFKRLGMSLVEHPLFGQVLGQPVQQQGLSTSSGGSRQGQAETEPRRGQGGLDSQGHHKILLSSLLFSQQEAQSAEVITGFRIRGVDADGVLVLELCLVQWALLFDCIRPLTSLVGQNGQ